MKDLSTTKELIRAFVEENRRVTFTELCDFLKEKGYEDGKEILSVERYENVYVWIRLDEVVKLALEELLAAKQVKLIQAKDTFDVIMLLDRTEEGHILRRKYPFAAKKMKYKKPRWMPHWIAAADFHEME